MPVVQGLRGVWTLRNSRSQEGNRVDLKAGEAKLDRRVGNRSRFDLARRSGTWVTPSASAHHFDRRRACHSSAVISQISAGNLPETNSRSSVATMRIPCLSEMRRDASLAIAFGDSQDRKFQNVKPIVGDRIASFAHQALPSATASPSQNPRL